MRLVFSLAPHAGVRPASTARAPAHTATRAARRAHRDRASDANASLPVEPDARERARAEQIDAASAPHSRLLARGFHVRSPPPSGLG